MESVESGPLGRRLPLARSGAREAAAAGVERRVRVWLALCAAGSLAGYLLLLLVVRQLQTAEPSHAGEVLGWLPRLTRESLAKDQATAAIRFPLLVVALFVCYGLALRALGGQRSGRLEAAVFACGAVFLALQLLQPVMLSTDVYAYTLYGRMFALYGDDPYQPAYFKYPNDPYTPLTYGLPWPSWYGPLWTLLSSALALVGGERVGLAVLLFRGLAIGSALAAGALIWLTLRRIAPERAAQGMAFFLWNPLVVLETGTSAHNDAFMAALLLLGVWLYTRGWKVLAVAAFSLSALVKLATGLVLPLYILMVLRTARSWGERLRFLALGALVGAITVGAMFGLARTSPLLPVLQSSRAAYFYDNNVYQIVFPLLRIQLGEEPDSARVPVHFYPWWATTEREIPMRQAPSEEAPRVERIEEHSLLLVIGPRDERWVWVYNLKNGRQGYVREAQLAKAERPHERANADPVLGRLERNPATGPIATQANDLLRLVTSVLFALVYLVAAWRTSSLPRFLTWSTIVFLAAYWLVATEIWPWYVIWALALAALITPSWPARLALILSATVLSLYVTIGYERTAQSWLFTYRSLFAFVLPLVVFAVWEVGRRVVERRSERARDPSTGSG